MTEKDATFDSAACAALLLERWNAGGLLEALPIHSKPSDLADGYDAQDALLSMAGGRRAGWKLGVGSPAAMRAGGLARPLVGQLEASRLHTHGSTIVLPDGAPVTIECEIAFVLGRDVEPGHRPALADLIESARVTFEVVRSRFVDPRAVGWPSFAADNVGFEALVVSEPVPLDRLKAINDGACVWLDGAPTAHALSGDDATDPMRSLGFLLDHAAERGVTLRRGDLVTTGAMCKPFRLQGTGHEISASFEGGPLRFHI